jgi:hypothetical protein
VTDSQPRPGRLTAPQLALALAGIREGQPIEDVARALGTGERVIWRSVPWGDLDSALHAAIVRSLARAAERLAAELPACHALLAGQDAAAAAGTNGEAQARQPRKGKGRGRRKKRKPRAEKTVPRVPRVPVLSDEQEQPVEPEQADDPAFAETWTLAHARKADEPPDAVPFQADDQPGRPLLAHQSPAGE